MRRTLCLSLCIAIGIAVAATGEEITPHLAQVSGDDTPVHSGPGRNYYVTGRLRGGAQVEVYRRESGGWLAIRPPEGSFSLVSSRYIRAGDDGLGVVLEDRVMARVGSLESDERNVVQVRLSRGEKVQLLEPQPVTSPAAHDSWYMIAPPAGEFRWIHESSVTGAPAQWVDSGRSGPRTGAPRRQTGDIEADVADSVTADATALGTRLATYQLTGADDRRAAPPEGERGWTASAPERRATATESTLGGATPTRPTPPPRVASVRGELDSIELALSQMVVEDASQWDFSDLRRRAEGLLAQSVTAVERGRSRLLLKKIARFAQIADGYASVRASGMQEQRPVAPLAAMPPAPAPEVTAAGRMDSRSEAVSATGMQIGVGRLTQVVSRRAGAPSFALLDESRQVRYFVTPGPGINLRSYVGKRVGITGSTTFNADLNKHQLTAQRVEMLADSVLRR